MKIQAAVSTESIYQLAQYYMPENLVVIADVLAEVVFLKWYKEGHCVKVKMLLLDQMKMFLE
jgi:hypothetical protein